jgi:putative transposase
MLKPHSQRSATLLEALFISRRVGSFKLRKEEQGVRNVIRTGTCRKDSVYKRPQRGFFPESHQRSWWIVHTQPTRACNAGSFPNPTNAVGVSFIPSGPLSSKVQLSYARGMRLEPFKEISWAFQLHYHVCFRTHRRKTVFDDQPRIAVLSQALTDLCKINDLHLIEKDCQPEHVQLVLSLRPSQIISDALKRLKGRSSAAICQEFGLTPPLWARGYLARSAGRVRVQAAKRYLANQAEHHGYSKRALPPVFRFRATERELLATAHASFDLTHHLVFATRFRRGVFDSKTGEALVNYWIKVAARRAFAIDQATVLPDHVHLLVRMAPKVSVEQVVLSLMNNGQYFVAKHFPLTLVEAKIDQLWQPSAYVGTCGELTTALLKAFLRGANIG